jgi:RNA polymerase sigma factor (sigma-70 family)
MIELSDERLARRGAQGDQRAFEAIYRRYHQQLYRFCLALVGNPHDAQDALQNTMVKVLRALPGETRLIELKPWLYRIARNEAIETLRRRRDQVELEPEEAAPGAAPLAERVEDRDRLRQLFADLGELPERQRAALLMRELSGLSFEQIATALETTPATARQTLYEARLGLRQMEAGREMGCQEAMRALSEADGRSRRRRDLRAHLRACGSCRAFATEIEQRRTELAALAPLPLAVSSGILRGLVSSGSAGKALAGPAVAKSGSAIAVAALVSVSVAGRVGLIDIPLASRDSSPANGMARSAAGASRPENPPSPAAGHAPRGHAPAEAHSASGTQESGLGKETVTGPSKQAPAPPGGGQPAGDTPSSSPVARAPANRGRGEGAGGRPGAAATRSPAAEHGQQVAASHKPPQASPSPGDAGRENARPPHNTGAPSSPPVRAPASPPKAEPARPAPETPSGTPEQPQEPEHPASGEAHGPDGRGHAPF